MTKTIRPQLTHAGLNVYDLEKMRHFYIEIMGLIETDRGRGNTFKSDFIFMSADPKRHHQLILATGRDPGSRKSTVNQISFTVGSIDELRTMNRRVKEYGVQNLRGLNHGNAWSIYFDDPEGNTVEIYLDTPWQVSQPHGDPLDLERSDDEIVRETEAICRQDPTFLPAADWQDRMRRALGQVAAE
jgi:catechol 2,3-dioxygenase